MMKQLFISFLVIVVACGQAMGQEGVRDTFIIKYNLDIHLDSADRPYKSYPNDVKERSVKVTPQKYSVKNFKTKLDDENPKIKIYPVGHKAPEDLIGNYVKLGFGPLYATPYLEVLTNSKRNENYQYGAYYNHMSSAKGSVDKKNSGQSFNEVDLFGKRFGEKQTLSMHLGYTRARFNYYGYNQNLGIGERDVRDSIKQVYQNIYSEVSFEGVDTTRKLTNKNIVGFYYTSDFYEAREWSVYTKNRLKLRMKRGQFCAPIDFFYGPYQNSAVNSNRIFASIKPSYSSKVGQRISYSVGVNFVYDNDQFPEANNVHFYPSLMGAYTFNRVKMMSVYLKIDGDMKRNSFKEFVEINPYLNQGVSLRNTSTRINLEIGSKGYLTKGFHYSTFIAYKKVQNLAYYLNNAVDQSKLDVVYASDPSDVFSAKGTFSYSKPKKYDLSVSARYDNYNLQNVDKAYHLPAFTGKLITGYFLTPKLKSVIEMYFMSGLFAYDFQNQSNQSLGTISDLNLGLEYFVNEKLSLFGNFNNLLNKDYERYSHYNTKRFNFIAGLSYAF